MDWLVHCHVPSGPLCRSSTVSQQVVDGLLATFAEPAMAYFVEALSDTDPDKLESLAEMIEEKRKARRDK